MPLCKHCARPVGSVAELALPIVSSEHFNDHIRAHFRNKSLWDTAITTYFLRGTVVLAGNEKQEISPISWYPSKTKHIDKRGVIIIIMIHGLYLIGCQLDVLRHDSDSHRHGWRRDWCPWIDQPGKPRWPPEEPCQQTRLARQLADKQPPTNRWWAYYNSSHVTYQLYWLFKGFFG